MSLQVPAVTPEQAKATPTILAGPLNSITWQERSLYGGAIVAHIPKRFDDCSDFRHIPDHQEVWADGSTDQSIIIELNSYDESVPDQHVAQHYQTELAQANEALTTELVQTGIIPHTEMPSFGTEVHKSFCITSQRITKFTESEDKANTMQIYMAVIRLKHVTTDLLISFNVPMQFGSGSSSEGRTIMSSEENVAVITGVLKSLQVKDWNLFG